MGCGGSKPDEGSASGGAVGSESVDMSVDKTKEKRMSMTKRRAAVRCASGSLERTPRIARRPPRVPPRSITAARTTADELCMPEAVAVPLRSLRWVMLTPSC
jgi:hypothetical protein